MNNALLRQIFVVSTTLLAAISTGGLFGIPSVLIQQLKKNDSLIQIDLDTETWIALVWIFIISTHLRLTAGHNDFSIRRVKSNIINNAGPEQNYGEGELSASVHGFAGIPSIFTPYIMQCWGRRVGFQVTCLPMLVGWILLSFANSSLTIIIAEIFQGISFKCLLVVCMTTISEMVEPKIRNQTFLIFAVFQTSIVLFVHTAGNYIHWKIISLTMCFPLALAIIFSYIWPESPAWLAYKGRFEESKKSFIWLRGKNKESLEEMNALFSAQREFLRAELSTKTLNRSKPVMRSMWQKISSRDFYLPIFHMFVLQTCYYWSGNLLIVVYAINIVGKVTKNSETAFIAMIVLDLAFIFGNLNCLILLKFFDNKPILLIGGAFSIVFLLASSTILYLQEMVIIADDSLLCLYFLVGFMLCSSTALYMIPFGVATEIIPLRHRGVAGSIYIMIMSISYTSFLKIVPYAILTLGTYGVFVLNAFILSICLTWIWKYVPETRNKTLQSIEEYFVNNSKDFVDLQVIINEETNEMVSLNNKN